MCVDLGTALMVGGGLLSAGGQIASASAQSKAAKYNAEVQRQNAMLAERQAKNVLEAGAREEQKQKAMTQQLIGKQRAAYAASGIDATFGSAFDTQINTAMLGATDAATIKRNTYLNYDDVKNQAVSYRNQASLYDMEARNTRTAGLLGAFGTVLTTGAGAYKNAKAYKLNGIGSIG